MRNIDGSAVCGPERGGGICTCICIPRLTVMPTKVMVHVPLSICQSAGIETTYFMEPKLQYRINKACLWTLPSTSKLHSSSLNIQNAIEGYYF